MKIKLIFAAVAGIAATSNIYAAKAVTAATISGATASDENICLSTGGNWSSSTVSGAAGNSGTTYSCSCSNTPGTSFVHGEGCVVLPSATPPLINVFAAPGSNTLPTSGSSSVTLGQGQYFIIYAALEGGTTQNQNITITNLAQLKQQGFTIPDANSLCSLVTGGEDSNYCFINVYPGLATPGTYTISLANSGSSPLSTSSIQVTVAESHPMSLAWNETLKQSGNNNVNNAMSADNAGNLYITGDSYNDYGGAGYYLASYNSATGALNWKKYASVMSSSYGNGVTTDAAGNIYLTGETSTGMNGQALQSEDDLLLAKFNPAGNILWSRQSGTNSVVAGTKNNNSASFGEAVTTDSYNNIYVVGYNRILTNGTINGSVPESYILAKYTTDGTPLWTKYIGAGGQIAQAHGVVADASGNVYVTGGTDRAFGGQTQHGGQDYFLAKYDNNGNMLWSRQAGGKNGQGGSQGEAVVIDSKGYVYVTGPTNVNVITGAVSQQTYFLAKYDSSGNMLWTQQVKDTQGQSLYSQAMTIDKNDNIYITGYNSGEYLGVYAQAQYGISDYFVTKYDTNGNLILAREFGADGDTIRGQGITVGSDSSIYLSGYLNDSSGNYWNTFISKYVMSN